MIRYWMLEDGHRLVPTEDVLEWARALVTTDRRVAASLVGRYEVSTFFIGLVPPALFETITFLRERRPDGGRETADIEGGSARYATWEEAEAGHWAIVDRLMGEG